MRDLALYRSAVSQVSHSPCDPTLHVWHQFRSDDGNICPVCRDTDWPLASWIVASATEAEPRPQSQTQTPIQVER